MRIQGDPIDPIVAATRNDMKSRARYSPNEPISVRACMPSKEIPARAA
jgi:hypothetical protein